MFFPITNMLEQCLQRHEPFGAWEPEEDWPGVVRKEQLHRPQEAQAQ